MKRVIIESPYAGGPLTRWRNRLYARACMRDSIMRGEAPYASHLLLTQRGILRDESLEERKLGISIGLEWGGAAELTVVYLDFGVTQGMHEGVIRASQQSREIEFRELPRNRWSPMLMVLRLLT